MVSQLNPVNILRPYHSHSHFNITPKSMQSLRTFFFPPGRISNKISVRIYYIFYGGKLPRCNNREVSHSVNVPELLLLSVSRGPDIHLSIITFPHVMLHT